MVGIALADAGGRIQARAYPIQLIGYHHQVRDVVAGQPVMVTYCTVCRTGRVFSPLVDGTADTFRLVGMDHWNAMFEDARTGSWWRQATGEAVAGPRKGARLAEIPSRQMTWAAWSARHPGSDVLQPDPLFAPSYARMAGFAEGTSRSALTGRDPQSWQRKSWVVGVLAGDAARAFDWNELARERVLNDRVGDQPVLLLLGADGASFHVFDARPGGSARRQPNTRPRAHRRPLPLPRPRDRRHLGRVGPGPRRPAGRDTAHRPPRLPGVLALLADLPAGDDGPRQNGGLAPVAGVCYRDIIPAMGQLLVRNLDDDVKVKLQRRARRHGRSTEEEVRVILRNAVTDESAAPAPLGSRLAARFAALGLDAEIPELRDSPAHPAEFEP